MKKETISFTIEPLANGTMHVIVKDGTGREVKRETVKTQFEALEYMETELSHYLEEGSEDEEAHMRQG